MLSQKTKTKLMSFVALLLTVIITIGVAPIEAHARQMHFPAIEEYQPVELQPFTIQMDGEDVEVPYCGILMVSLEGFPEPIAVEIPRYVYLDGERIYIDDERVENVAPVIPAIMPLGIGEAPLPHVGVIVAVTGLPVGVIHPHDETHQFSGGRLRMNGNIVSERRYVVSINGVEYEAYCADPPLRGPESPGAAYVMTGISGEIFRAVLRYGHPNNPYMNSANDAGRAWNSYMTRVAVAAVGNPDAVWTMENGNPIDATTRAHLDNFMAGTVGNTPGSLANYPAITVNGEIDRDEMGDTPTSPTFNVASNRRSNCGRSPFHFEWAAGTPAGTELFVNGTLVATAPANPTDIFYSLSQAEGNPRPPWIRVSDFHFVMPADSAGQTARVNMVGTNNVYANRVFVMQNNTNPETWQDIGATRS